ncbi:MAG: hypothetical protein FWD76_03640 [Firmicutes bacterium]|nr:hypothetical protein [Bacillota bacterium]
MKKNASVDLRSRASQAKKRLVQGFYEQKTDEKNDAILCAQENGFGSLDAEVYKRIAIKREVELSHSQALAKEEEMYQKVCRLLQADGDVMDPIGKLVDRSVFDSLTSATAKQKYILDLAAKFREMSERYRNEKLYKR